jgi:hypothetical protein
MGRGRSASRYAVPYLFNAWVRIGGPCIIVLCSEIVTGRVGSAAGRLGRGGLLGLASWQLGASSMNPIRLANLQGLAPC